MVAKKQKPVRKSFLIFGSPRIEEAEIRGVVETLRSGWLSTGPKVVKFEEMFKKIYRGKIRHGAQFMHGRASPCHDRVGSRTR